MPGCCIAREVIGSTARYVVNGKFEGSCAWDMAARLTSEPLSAVHIDFSQVGDFVDYGIAVVANAILSLPGKQVRLLGLRQHQERLFRYFGIEPAGITRRVDFPSTPPPSAPGLASKVA